MDLAIQRKVALITGAGRGLGRAIALSLAREGADIVAVSRTASHLEALLEELPGDTHLALSLDLQQADAVTQLIAIMESNQLDPDIIINNIGGK